MWCMTTSSTCSSVAEPVQVGADRQLARQVEAARARPRTTAPGTSSVSPTRQLRLGLVRRQDDLVRLAVGVAEQRPQRSCRATTSRSAARRASGSSGAGQPQRDRHVVGRGERPRAGCRNHRRSCANESGSGSGARRRPQRGPRRRRRRGEYSARPATVGASNSARTGSSTSERGADAGDHAGGQQRVAAEVEEAVVDADPVQPEDLGEDPGTGSPRGRARRPAVAARRGESGAGSAARSSLPFGVSGSASSTTNAAGHHVVGQASARRTPRSSAGSAHGAGRRRRRRRRGAGRRRRRAARRRRACATAGCAASAASISPSSMRKPRTLTWSSARPEVLQRAVGGPADQVAGAVHPLARRAERVGDEPLGGQAGPAAGSRAPAGARRCTARPARRRRRGAAARRARRRGCSPRAADRRGRTLGVAVATQPVT